MANSGLSRNVCAYLIINELPCAVQPHSGLEEQRVSHDPWVATHGYYYSGPPGLPDNPSDD